MARFNNPNNFPNFACLLASSIFTSLRAAQIAVARYFIFSPDDLTLISKLKNSFINSSDELASSSYNFPKFAPAFKPK